MSKQIFAAVILSVFFISCSICPAVNLAADIDKNSIVDFVDFAILANDWRQNGLNLKGDITGDLHVDYNDILELANFWLRRDPNLVGWWRFDEGSGAIIHDSARNNNGTVYGAAWTTGQINGALNFDGSDDYAEIPDNDDSLDMTSQMTIAAWVKPNSNDYVYIIAAKQPSGTASEDISGNYEFMIGGGYLTLWHQTDTMGNEAYYYSESSVTAGVWQHVVVTIKEGDDNVYFYINGVSAGAYPKAGTFGIVNNEPVRIGKRKFEEDGYWFYGAIDDVRIYNRALSGAEIQQIYQGLNP